MVVLYPLCTSGKKGSVYPAKHGLQPSCPFSSTMQPPSLGGASLVWGSGDLSLCFSPNKKCFLNELRTSYFLRM